MFERKKFFDKTSTKYPRGINLIRKTAQCTRYRQLQCSLSPGFYNTILNSVFLVLVKSYKFVYFIW